MGGYMQGYMSEKGKNLATHEDIDKVVDQVKAVTQTAKEIEAKISDQMWDRQKRWELKRDQLLLLADKSLGVKVATNNLSASLRTDDLGLQPPTKKLSSAEFALALHEAVVELEKVVLTVSLVCGEETVQAASIYASAVRNWIGLINTDRRKTMGDDVSLTEIVKAYTVVKAAMKQEISEP
jgi:hypothetical protein